MPNTNDISLMLEIIYHIHTIDCKYFDFFFDRGKGMECQTESLKYVNPSRYVHRH